MKRIPPTRGRARCGKQRSPIDLDVRLKPGRSDLMIGVACIPPYVKSILTCTFKKGSYQLRNMQVGGEGGPSWIANCDYQLSAAALTILKSCRRSETASGGRGIGNTTEVSPSVPPRSVFSRAFLHQPNGCKPTGPQVPLPVLPSAAMGQVARFSLPEAKVAPAYVVAFSRLHLTIGVPFLIIRAPIVGLHAVDGVVPCET
jgi:hypothetical protein